MEPQAPLQRRHIYIIDKEFQYRFLSTWLVMTLGFVLIILAVMMGGVTLLQQSDKVETVKLGVLKDMLFSNGLFVILLTLFLALYLLLLSHRVAGPAYRITKSVERMIAGDYDFAVVLRRKDYMKDVAGSVNTLLKDLQERQQQVRIALDEATRVTAALKTGGAPPAEIQGSAVHVCEILNGLLKKRDVGLDSQIQSMPDPAAGAVSAH